jgi:hypothetical protein
VGLCHDDARCVHAKGHRGAEDLYLPGASRACRGCRALNVLAARKYMDQKHVFVIGSGRSTSLVFAAIERGGAERTAKRRFRGAVAFYPAGCGAVRRP